MDAEKSFRFVALLGWPIEHEFLLHWFRPLVGEHLAKRDVGAVRLCGGGHLIADVGLCQPVESNAVGCGLDVERESGLVVKWVGAGGQFLAVGHAVAVRIVG